MMAKNHKVEKNILFLKERIRCRERRHTKEEVTVTFTSLIPKTTHISHIPIPHKKRRRIQHESMNLRCVHHKNAARSKIWCTNAVIMTPVTHPEKSFTLTLALLQAIRCLSRTSQRMKFIKLEEGWKKFGLIQSDVRQSPTSLG